MEAVKILEGLLSHDGGLVPGANCTVEAEPAWFPKTHLPPERRDGTEGEAQAMLRVDGKLYALTLEALP